MNKPNVKLSIFCVVAVFLVAAGPVLGKTTFNIDCYDQWEKALNPDSPWAPRIRPISLGEWNEYIDAWYNPDNILEGEPYPHDAQWGDPQLYPYPGGGTYIDPDTGLETPYEFGEDAGLVMVWGVGAPQPVDATVAGAWVYEWGEDPDISRSVIQAQVYVPELRPFGLGGKITQVSLGIRDAQFQHRYWYWKTGPGQTIPYKTWTTITINPSMAGVNAATPTADGFSGSWFFDPKIALCIYVDENGLQVGGTLNIPDPSKTSLVTWYQWNYWSFIRVLPNPNPPTQPPGPTPKYTGKYHIKWSQPPEVIDHNVPMKILGWDELSDYRKGPIMADDWQCKDDRPVTDIHWWGSFLGWGEPYPPPILPRAFHIGIWTNVKAGQDPALPFSHPAHLVWENFCDNWVWNFYGYDEDPRQDDPDYKETCFQFNQLLSEDEWFYQEPNEPNTIYWLSIAAIYDPNVYTDPNFYPWGWKTRPWHFEDDAVRITNTINTINGNTWPPIPPTVCSKLLQGNPVWWPDPDHSWDLSFELTTIYPDPNDDKPPGPDPIDWDVPPMGVAPTVITMTAKTLTDENGVEYYFDELTGNPGGDDSGWQDSSGYTDSGLDPNTTYIYRFKARDKSPNKNETGWSSLATGAATTPLPTLVDYNADKLVNAKDLAYFANKWLTSGP